MKKIKYIFIVIVLIISQINLSNAQKKDIISSNNNTQVENLSNYYLNYSNNLL